MRGPQNGIPVESFSQTLRVQIDVSHWVMRAANGVAQTGGLVWTCDESTSLEFRNGAKTGAVRADDIHLARLIDVWETLPESARIGILFVGGKAVGIGSGIS